ncbi:MAG: hypothetical protein AAGI03_14455 [Pseudomonadota bacterium]
MTPHVREAENAPIAVNASPARVATLNASNPAARAIHKTVKASKAEENAGPGLLTKRRRRWARLSVR